MVKNTPFPLDTSISFGKLLDSYKYCKNGNWELMETDRGQKYVEFRGEYAIDELVKYDIGSDQNLANYVSSFVDYLSEYDFKVNLIAQFTISADDKSFSPSFLGLEYKGINTETGSLFTELLYKSIKSNAPCDLPNEASMSYKYLFHKFIITSNKNIIRSIFAWRINNNDDEHIYVFNVDKMNYDDKKRAIAITGSFDETNITIKQIKQAGIQLPREYDPYDSSFLSEIISLNINEHVVKRNQIYLTSMSARGIDSLKQMYFRSDNTDSSIMYKIDIKTLIPLKTEIFLEYKQPNFPAIRSKSID
jgi:hypothetical protein